MNRYANPSVCLANDELAFCNMAPCVMCLSALGRNSASLQHWFAARKPVRLCLLDQLVDHTKRQCVLRNVEILTSLRHSTRRTDHATSTISTASWLTRRHRRRSTHLCAASVSRHRPIGYSWRHTHRQCSVFLNHIGSL